MSDLSLALQKFIQLWQSNHSIAHAEEFLSPNIHLVSSHRGEQNSIAEVVQHLQDEFHSHASTKIYVTNIVEKQGIETGKISAYFYGQTSLESTTFFGGMIILTLSHHLIHSIKIQMNWVDGDRSQLAHWSLPLERLWKPNDPKASAIISELDALWHDPEKSINPSSAEEQITELWYRYAWGLDLADAQLYVDLFSDQASVKLPPMGTLTGPREIIATLKAFRMPWPSIQHYGEPLQIQIELENKRAELTIGRIIPQQAHDTDGHSIYAAHYQIELLLSPSNQWKIHSMSYIPGWIRLESE